MTEDAGNKNYNEDDDEKEIEVVFLMILGSGDLSMLTSENMTKEQKEVLERILLVCSETSLVFEFVLYLERLFGKISSFISKILSKRKEEQ